ncbi:hypothetical protein AB0M69_32315, partial [Streptomyces syringium]
MGWCPAALRGQPGDGCKTIAAARGVVRSVSGLRVLLHLLGELQGFLDEGLHDLRLRDGLDDLAL